ncbi:MAG: O-antigen/teichoic acid export membrane protein [Colwellia sp.]|jgi:O-antigen/teichoic acid export membrane protein
MNLLKSLSIYTLSSLISRAVPFFMLPIMTSYLSPEQYGVIAVVMVLVTLISSPLFFGITAYINIEYYHLDESSHKKLVSTLLLIPFLLLVPASLIFYFYQYLEFSTWSIPHFWFISIPLVAVMTFFYRIVTVLFRVKEQANYFGLFEIIYSLLQVGLAIIFVVALSEGLEGRLWSIFIANMLINIVAFFILFKQGYITAGFDKTLIKGCLKYGAGLIPHELSGQLIRMVDRLFIIAILGASAAGLYAVAAQVASIALVVISVFNLAWQPYVFKCLTNGGPFMKEHLVKLSRLVLLGFTVFFIFLNFAVPYIYQYFIAQAYQSSIDYVFWLLLGFFFLAIYTLFCDYIFFVKKTYLLSITTSCNLLLTILLNYIFVTKYGAIGSAYAFACASFFACLLVITISTNVYKMPWLKIHNA